MSSATGPRPSVTYAEGQGGQAMVQFDTTTEDGAMQLKQALRALAGRTIDVERANLLRTARRLLHRAEVAMQASAARGCAPAAWAQADKASALDTIVKLESDSWRQHMPWPWNPRTPEQRAAAERLQAHLAHQRQLLDRSLGRGQ